MFDFSRILQTEKLSEKFQFRIPQTFKDLLDGLPPEEQARIREKIRLHLAFELGVSKLKATLYST